LRRDVFDDRQEVNFLTRRTECAGWRAGRRADERLRHTIS
jgi:hypothetical protein